MDHISKARFMTVYRGLPQCAPWGTNQVGTQAVWARVDTTTHKGKPKGLEVAKISNRLMKNGAAMRISLRALAAVISVGGTVLPGMCVGKRTQDRWRFQDLFFVDVDNDPNNGWPALGYLDAIERAFLEGLPLVMSYETFSSSQDPCARAEAERYRLMFSWDRTIHKKAEAEEYARALAATYPEADRSSGELNRLFYGTDKEVVVWAV